MTHPVAHDEVSHLHNHNRRHEKRLRRTIRRQEALYTFLDTRDLWSICSKIHSGIFAAMDGTTMDNGPGPRSLIPIRGDYILASADQVAVDAVAAKIMGFNPMDLIYIRLANEEGLGNSRPGNIEEVNLNFHVGDDFASKFGDVLWFGPLKAIQKLFFHTPLVNIFVAASHCYHDNTWWPKHGQPIFDEWKKESPWGQLWNSY